MLIFFLYCLCSYQQIYDKDMQSSLISHIGPDDLDTIYHHKSKYMKRGVLITNYQLFINAYQILETL